METYFDGHAKVVYFLRLFSCMKALGSIYFKMIAEKMYCVPEYGCIFLVCC